MLKTIQLPVGFKNILPVKRPGLTEAPHRGWLYDAEYILNQHCIGKAPNLFDKLHANIGDVVKSFFIGCYDQEAVFEAIKKSFGRNNSFFVEFDLSVCQEKINSTSLFGAPPGYAGYEQGSPVAKAMEMASKSLVSYSGNLFDAPIPVIVFKSLDKCHHDIQGALVSLVKDGIFGAASGSLKMSQCIVIFLSNDTGEKRLLLSLKRNGASAYNETLLRDLTILNVDEPSPVEFISHVSLHAGYEFCRKNFGLAANAAGRCRAGGVLTNLFKKIGDNDTVDEIFQKILAGVGGLSKDNCNPKILKDVPPQGKVVVLDNGLNIESIENLKTNKIDISLPMAYLMRHDFGITRTDLWGSFEGIADKINTDIRGQDIVIDDFEARLRSSSVENKSHLPILTTLLVGSTGSGKTALAETLAKHCKKPLIFLDCNTWKDEDEIYKALFGESQNSLINQLKVNPAAVVLLDEVDKAHPKIWSLMMNILSKGCIIDKTNKAYSLKNCILIATSNYLSAELGGYANHMVGHSAREVDAKMRNILQGGGIDAHYLERVDAIYLMMPVEGENSIGLWQKLLSSKMASLGMNGEPSEDVCRFLEQWHGENGNGKGARARIRSLNYVFSDWVNGVNRFFDNRNNGIELSKHIIVPQKFSSERERFWKKVGENKQAFCSKYHGNTEIVNSVFDLLERNSFKKSPKSPVGTILLVGPTRSGKTFFGQALGDVMKKNVLKVECQQLTGNVSNALFGAPNGYIDSDKGGILTKPILKQKDQVVIFDEINRANESFMDCIMNVLREGVAQDQSGMPVDLKQCAFFMTTNSGWDEICLELLPGMKVEDQEAVCRGVLSQYFLPEHLERIDMILPVVYNDEKVSPKSILRSFCDEMGINLSFDIGVEDYLIKEKNGILGDIGDITQSRIFFERKFMEIFNKKHEKLFIEKNIIKAKV